ncbi:hypothetical protein B0H34DRAFT_655382 [Crassisporium funariophilum]|nr:hypothetical protein B0H34DRAFT_655382 [Crassisporium funariophilum]
MSTAVAPPGPPLAPPAQNDLPGALNTISWEGDKMFNIYIYDYCFKRGFRKTARELMQEADIPAEASPPIDARQGLLFECVLLCWSCELCVWLIRWCVVGGGVSFGFSSRRNQAVDRRMHWSTPRYVLLPGSCSLCSDVVATHPILNSTP